MHGVRTFSRPAAADREDVEIHRNGAIVSWAYTEAGMIHPERAARIAYVAEFQRLGLVLELAARFYREISYTGPLTVYLEVICAGSYALQLARPGGARPNFPALEPAGQILGFVLSPVPLSLLLTKRPWSGP